MSVRIVRTDTGFSFRSDYRVVAETRTGPGGGYEGVLPGACVRGTETDADWIVTASLPAGTGEAAGASSSFEFEVNTAGQEAPPLPLRDVAPEVRLEGWRATVTVPGGAIKAAPGPLVFAGGLSARGVSATFDLRLDEPEDFGFQPRPVVAGGRAYVDVTVRHGEGRTIYHQTINTPTRAVIPSSHLVPPSRRASCAVTFSDGAMARSRGCADGEFKQPVWPAPAATEAGQTATAPPVVTAATLELAEPVEADLVVLRGCTSRCGVEVSADGSTWSPSRPVTSTITPDVPAGDIVYTAEVRPRQVARFVRVTTDGTNDALREISVWPDAPPGAPAPPDRRPPEAAVGDERLPAPGTGGAWRRTALAGAAGTLVLLVGGAILRVRHDRARV